MSKLIYLFAVVYIVFSFVGCDQDIDYPYEGKDRIQFKHFSTCITGVFMQIRSCFHSVC